MRRRRPGTSIRVAPASASSPASEPSRASPAPCSTTAGRSIRVARISSRLATPPTFSRVTTKATATGSRTAGVPLAGHAQSLLEAGARLVADEVPCQRQVGQRLADVAGAGGTVDGAHRPAQLDADALGQLQ